jgi:outer membrane protein OmpA-like peptidoglycan-associated protein
MSYSIFTLSLAILTLVNVDVNSQNQLQSFSIYFDSGADKASKKYVDSLFTKYDISGADSIQLIGFCDTDGSIDYNKNLALRRINYVVTEFIRHGLSVDNKSIKSIAKGEIDPSYPNDNETNKAKNRRVDIFILSYVSPKTIETVSTQKGTIISPKLIEKIPITIELLNQKIDESLKTGDNIELNDVLFRPGLDVFQPYSMPTLEVLYKVLNSRKDLKIEIQGHVCCVDENQFDGKNYRSGSTHLSEDRAEAVKEYLVNLGINPRNISTRGFGGSQRKVYPELSEEDRARNRRVEIKVLN